MDVILLATFALGLVIMILLLIVLSRKGSGSTKSGNDARDTVQGQMRRAAGTRNNRRRMQGNAVHREEEGGERNVPPEDDDAAEDKAEGIDGKMGAKKRAKLEAKAEKKREREAMEQDRAERKKRELLLQEERDRQSEKERIEEAKREEEERKAREEKERREHEEYLKLKEAFSVEEEGYKETEDDQKNLLQDFVDYIKRNKVVVLEDIAAHYGMKTASVIQRIQDLQADGILSGVIDDRGKFIYISQQELEAVAKFVRQRGRVSIVDLAENSSSLINLTPISANAVEA